jgi:hypothetical protein
MHALPPEYVVEIAPGADLSDPGSWAWLDITGDVRTKQAITMVRGLRDEGRRADPSTLDLQINNRDGRYSPRNPGSDLFGQIRRNTPIRVRMGSEVLFPGFVPAWPIRWSRGGTDSWVPLKAAGILRRLQQGTPRARSALEMAIATHARVAAFGATDPALKAYWTLEEMTNAAASVGEFPAHPDVEGLPDMLATAAVDQLGSVTPLGSQPIPTFPTSAVTSMNTYDLAPFEDDVWRFDFLAVIRDLPEDGTGTPLRTNLLVLNTTGSLTSGLMRFRVDVNGAIWLEAGSSAELSLTVTPTFDVLAGPVLISLLVDASTDEATLTVSQALRGSVIASSSDTDTATVAIGYPRQHSVPFDSGVAFSSRHIPVGIGHIAISQGAAVAGGPGVIYPARAALAELAPWTDPDLSALNGWDGEPAGLRLIRVAHDSGLLFELVDNPGTELVDAVNTRLMGPQPSAALVPVLNECPDVDGGLLFERGFGLGYRRRVDQFNQTPVLTLGQGQLAEAPQPDDGEQLLKNEIRCEGPDGVGVVVKDQVSIDTEGLYGRSVRRNAFDLGVLRAIANDLLRVGTVDELRWPSITFSVAAQDLVAERFELVEGRVITLAHEWAQLPGVTPVDLIVQGWTDTLTRERWLVELNCIPASPWQLEDSMTLIAYEEHRGKIAYTSTPGTPDELFTIADVPLEAGFNYLIVGETKAGHDGTNALAVGTMAEINLYLDTTRIARSYHRPDSSFIISSPGFQQRCRVERAGVTVENTGTYDVGLYVRAVDISTSDDIEIGCEVTEPFEEANWLAVYRVGLAS